MGALTDYLNIIVDKIGKVLQNFNIKNYKEATPSATVDKISEVINLINSFIKYYPNMPEDLKIIVFIDLKDQLKGYNAFSFGKDFVSAKENFKVNILRNLVEGLRVSNWHKFKNFKKLERMTYG